MSLSRKDNAKRKWYTNSKATFFSISAPRLIPRGNNLITVEDLKKTYTPRGDIKKDNK